jgi:hypothetical protein
MVLVHSRKHDKPSHAIVVGCLLVSAALMLVAAMVGGF